MDIDLCDFVSQVTPRIRHTDPNRCRDAQIIGVGGNVRIEMQDAMTDTDH